MNLGTDFSQVIEEDNRQNDKTGSGDGQSHTSTGQFKENPQRFQFYRRGGDINDQQLFHGHGSCDGL